MKKPYEILETMHPSFEGQFPWKKPMPLVGIEVFGTGVFRLYFEGGKTALFTSTMEDTFYPEGDFIYEQDEDDGG